MHYVNYYFRSAEHFLLNTERVLYKPMPPPPPRVLEWYCSTWKWLIDYDTLLTFSFIFSIFFTELRLWCLSSSRIWNTGSPDRPICFSSCFSASFSLLSALMLSVWYMWYVFMTYDQKSSRWAQGRGSKPFPLPECHTTFHLFLGLRAGYNI